MAKPNQVKPAVVQPVNEVQPQENKPAVENNVLANFINSENTDITVEKNEAELNDKIDDSEKESQFKSAKSAQEKLKDIPKKYWKHQTV